MPKQGRFNMGSLYNEIDQDLYDFSKKEEENDFELEDTILEVLECQT